MKPLISYYGGKQRMAPKIVPLLPRHTVYVEPFAGGAAILFAKPWPPASNNNHYREVVNDLDQELANLYRVIRTPGLRESFIERLQLTPYARIEYRAAVAMRSTGSRRPAEEPAFDYYEGLDPAVARAVGYYINIQCSFANKINGGWGTGVWGSNPGAIWANKIARLPEYLERMAGVHVECDDAMSVIKRWDSPQTLFYCDPPYPDTRQGYHDCTGRGGYTQEDFGALVSCLSECQGSFVLSNYDQPGVPDDWERFEFAARSSAQGNGRGTKTASEGFDRTKESTRPNTARTEVVWRVDRSETARPEARKIWEKWGWAKGERMPGK